MAQRGGVLPQFLSTVSPPPLPPHTHARMHTNTHTLPLLAIFPRQKKKRQLIYLQLCERGWRSGEESAARLSLADSGICVYVCVCAVYREWRQGYHSVRQNTLGSPSGRSCYHCTTTLQHTGALCSFAPYPCRIAPYSRGEQQTLQRRATISLFCS